MKKKVSLLTKLILFLVIPILIILLFSRTMVAVKEKNRLEKIIFEQQEEHLFSFENNIHVEAKNNLALASLFSRNPIVIQAYKMAYKGNIKDPNNPYSQKAREFLRAKLKPEFSAYKENMGHDVLLHFHLPRARSLVRLWRKKNAKKNGKWVDISDDISSFRKSIVDINTGKKKNIEGIEIGRGGFVIRGITGVYDNNKLLGSVEVLTRFSVLINKIQHSKNVSHYVLMKKEFLPIATALQNETEHPIIQDKYILADKMGILPDIFPESIFSDKIGKKLLNNLLYAALPIKNYSEQIIGYHVVVVDMTEKLMASKKKFITALSLPISSYYFSFDYWIASLSCFNKHISKTITKNA